MSSFRWPDQPHTTHFLCHRDDGRHVFAIDQHGYWYDPQGDPSIAIPTFAMMDGGYVGVRTEREINAVAYDDMIAVIKRLRGLIEESRGISGFHLNGDVAEWGEFDEFDGLDELIQRAEGAAKHE